MDKFIQEKLLKTVKQNYQEIAAHYTETRKKKIWPELEKYLQPIPDHSKVLDAGCGSGKILQILGDKNIEYLGIDNNNELIGYAKDQRQNKGGNFNFITDDMLNLVSVPDNYYDYIFCVAVLQHIPGGDLRVKALENLKRKAKPQGRIIITNWNMWSKMNLRHLILKFLFLKIIGLNKMDLGDVLFDWKNAQGRAVSRRYYHAFRKSELSALCQSAGLKIEKLYKDKFNYYLVCRK